jgi:hypothetical protein
MTPVEKPREWRLGVEMALPSSARVLHGGVDTLLHDEEGVRVVELEPMLDLLEDLFLKARDTGRLATHELLDAARFLREHGRLGL